MKLRALFTVALSMALMVLASGIAEAKPLWQLLSRPNW